MSVFEKILLDYGGFILNRIRDIMEAIKMCEEQGLFNKLNNTK